MPAKARESGESGGSGESVGGGEGRMAEAFSALARVVELELVLEHPDLESDRVMLKRVECELQSRLGEE